VSCLLNDDIGFNDGEMTPDLRMWKIFKDQKG